MMESIVRKFLYYPETYERNAPLPPYVQGAEEVWLPSSDGNEIHGLYWPARANRPTILFFHGNAQSVFEWALIRDEFSPLDCGLLLIDYPGYGKSTGQPHEEALYAAGHAALQWLINNLENEQKNIIVFGKSLGGGVAAEIVGKNSAVLGLILESTFRSIPSVLSQLLPMIPAGSVLKSENYDTAAKIGAIDLPLLLVHGVNDELIPLREAKELFGLANEPKQLYLVERAGHNDVSIQAGPEYGRTLRQWLDKIHP